MVLIALKRGKVLRLPLRSYRQYNRISQFRFDNFNAQILQGDETNVPVKLLATNISQSNLWHQRLAHTNYEVIRALLTETTGGPDQKLQLPSKVCDGCEKGKSRCLPFPPSMSRAKQVLYLVHSDLDVMSSASIDGYIYTATYLDDHSRYGMMFFLKNKSQQFGAFKAYKVWAERQIDSSNASEQIEVVSSSPMNRRSSWKNPELNTKCQCQTPHNKMGELNGSSKPY